MSLGRNLLAGWTNSIWSALIGLAVVPFYLKYLGMEAYGLIGFFVTTQALLQLLDLGIAPTISREVARCSVSGNLKEAGKLLHTLAVVSWCIAGSIVLFLMVLAPWIAEYWLQSKQLSRQTITHAAMLIGLVVACRWPIGIYQGALIGAQRLMVSSGINIFMGTIGNLGAVAILAFVSPTIEAFFIWQALIGLIYAIAMRSAAWRMIGVTKENNFDFGKLKDVWRFTAGMSAIGLTTLVFTQLDKALLSKMLSLNEFGHYMLATVVVSGLYLLVTPLFNVMYPRFSALVLAGDVEKLTELYRLGTRLLATALFPITMLVVVFSKDLVHAWTGNPEIALNVAPIIELLAIGSALHGIMHFPYALQLAYGMTRIPLMINAILMIALVPLIIYLALSYGALGGAMAWLVLHVLYVLLGTWLTHRCLLKGLGISWLFGDVGIPLLLSILVGLMANYFAKSNEYSVFVKLIGGVTLALMVSLLSILMSPHLRAAMLRHLGWKKENAVA
jgi:O-antigen/teichoic acid export membrane protein